MIFVSLFFSGLYLSVSYWLSRGLKKIDIKTLKKKQDLEFDIIVAAKDEEKSIGALLDSFLQLNYPKELLTITVVDDRSTDKTSEIVESYKSKFHNLNLIKITETAVGVSPKKNALTKAMAKTKSSYILFTDADSVVKPNWVSLIADRFKGDSNIGIVQGLTMYQSEKPTPLFLFQSVDFLSHATVSAAGFGQNLPINSNANNFAFSREVFEEADGYSRLGDITTGDDDLLVQQIWLDGKRKISFLADTNAEVRTKACSSVGEMLNQRKRWGSQTVHYAPKQLFILASIFLFYIVILLSIPSAIVGLSSWYLVLALFSVKIIGELFFMWQGTKLFKYKNLRPHLIWTSPIQLIIVIYAVLGGVLGGFSWKNDNFTRKIK